MSLVVDGFVELRFQQRLFFLHRDTIAKIKTLADMCKDCGFKNVVLDNDPDEFQEIVDFVVKLIKPKVTPRLHVLLDYWNVDHILPKIIMEELTADIDESGFQRRIQACYTPYQHHRSFTMRFPDGDLNIPFNAWIKGNRAKSVKKSDESKAHLVFQYYYPLSTHPGDCTECPRCADFVLIINAPIREKVCAILGTKMLSEETVTQLIYESDQNLYKLSSLKIK